MFEQSTAASTITQYLKKELPFLTRAARLMPKSVDQPPVRWPNPEESIGQYRSTLNGRKFWEIIDPGREKLGPLLAAVKSLLDTHHEDLKERETVPILFALFMVGRNETISCPTLVIICAKKGPRQKVVDVIRKSEILERYPGVLLGTSSKHPRNPMAGPPQSVAFGLEHGMQSSELSKTPIYVKKSEFPKACGESIYIPVDDENKLLEPRIFRKATIGGYLKLKGGDGMITLVAMTVAHAFEQFTNEDDVPQSSQESDGDDSVFEFDGASPEDLLRQDGSDNEKKSSSLTNHSDSSPKNAPLNDLPSTLSEEVPITRFEFQDFSTLEEIGTLYEVSVNRNSSVDWALVRIASHNLVVSNTFHIPAEQIAPQAKGLSEETDIEIITCTASKEAFTGFLCCAPTFLKIEGSQAFEEVLTMKLNGGIVYGDSGSWVVQKEYERLYGHIVAGDPCSGLAYVMPARRIFRDIELQLGCGVALSSKITIEPADIKQKAQPETSQVNSAPDTSILTPKLLEFVPERDGERHIFTPQELASRNEYFVPGDGIDVDVITADITLYLGNDVLLRTGSFQSITSGAVQEGYFITAFRNLTPSDIKDLKGDSKKWEEERRPPPPNYRDSTIHQSRWYYGPRESFSDLPLSYPASSTASQGVYDSLQTRTQSYSTGYSSSKANQAVSRRESPSRNGESKYLAFIEHI